jgi:glycosyltransferase involved in cell wall biosynthesis
VGPYIADCIRSVMRQTYNGPMECIIVDDCGTDSSMEIANTLIANYQGNIKFIIIHHDHNQGLSAARNTGMKASSGEYLYFLDSDDWISNDCIEQLVRPLEHGEFDIVVGDYDQTAASYPHLDLDAREGLHEASGPIFDILCNRGVYVMAVNKLYHRFFLFDNKLLFEEGRVHEDEIFAFDLSFFLKSIYVVKSITYHYRIRQDSIMGTRRQNDKIFIASLLGVYEVIKQRLINCYSVVEGVYDFYLFWVKRVFRWILSKNVGDDYSYLIDERIEGYLDLIPSIRHLNNKHNRLIYYFCKRDQSISRYEYVTEVLSNNLAGRAMRNILALIPGKS